MITQIAYVTILVRDQEEALAFYTEKLGMEKCEDDATSEPTTRWLTVAPKGQKNTVFTLRKAKESELDRVGKQTGRQFLCILRTDDCRRDYEILVSRGVKFLNSPKEEPFGGWTATFEDLYGNVLDLWEPQELKT